MRKGLFVYNKRQDSFIPIDFKEKRELPICFLYSGPQNELYIGTDGKGMSVYNNQTHESPNTILTTTILIQKIQKYILS